MGTETRRSPIRGNRSSGEDLYDLVAERGWEWVREALPTWVRRCASYEGSGDDTTVVLAMGPTCSGDGSA